MDLPNKRSNKVQLLLLGYSLIAHAFLIYAEYEEAFQICVYRWR